VALSTTCHRTRLCDLTQLIPLMNVKSETGYHGTIRLLRRIPAILGEKLQGFNDFFFEYNFIAFLDVVLCFCKFWRSIR
jgi:hypothetical protein